MERARTLFKLERMLELLVERPLNWMFRRKVQPAEIGRRLERELRNGRIISVRGAIAPNEFDVRLSPEDLNSFAQITSSLESQLQNWLEGMAREHRLDVVGAMRVSFAEDEKLRPGAVRIVSKVSERTHDFHVDHDDSKRTADFEVVTQTAPAERFVIEVGSGASAGRHFIIRKSLSSVGRDLSNDFVLTSPDVSRSHAEIELLDGALRVIDLSSLNGIFVNGRRVTGWALIKPGDQIMFATVTCRLLRTNE
jgi:FhaA, N-terminal domain/FHA domain